MPNSYQSCLEEKMPEKTVLEQESDWLFNLLTQEINPAVRTQALNFVATAQVIGHGGWKNLDVPCLFTALHLGATGEKWISKHDIGYDVVARSLGLDIRKVQHGCNIWDDWGRNYPEQCKLFLRRITDWLLEEGAKEWAATNWRIDRELAPVSDEASAMID